MSFIRILLFVFLIPFWCAAAEKQDLLFENISLQEGLSQSTINCIYQDRQGFIWFGTSNGLNKYDGYGFTVYHHNPSNSSSLSNDVINKIFEDSKGRLWIATENGINLFNRFPEKFTRFLENSIMTIDEDNSHNIIAGSYDHSLFIYDKGKNSFSRLMLKNNSDSSYIFCSYNDNSGNLWYGTSRGLLKVNTKDKNQEFFVSKKSNSIFSIAESKDVLYLGTEGNGILTYNIKQEKYISINSIEKISSQLKQRVTCIFFDSKNRLWIGTMGQGLYLINGPDGSVSKYGKDSKITSAAIDNNINTVVEDNSGILWFGSSLSGIYKLSLNKIKFAHYKKENGNLNSIYTLYKDHNNIVWSGSSEGFLSLDRTTGKTKTLSDKFIISVIEDKDFNLWVGTKSGLLKFDRNRKLIDLNIKDTLHNSFQKEAISDIIKDKNNDLWFLSARGTIYSLDFNSKKLSKFEIDRGRKTGLRAYSFIQDANGFFWICSYKGLYRFDVNTGTSVQFKHNEKDPASISTDIVFSAYEDKEGNVWVGTYGGGLNKYLKSQNKFLHFSEEEGLPNNVVYSVLHDKQDNLWLSTNKGICRFNTKTNKVRVFDVTDGLQSYEFNSGAYYLADDGEMFFGGLNGFNSFYPSAIKDNPHIPSVALTSVRVYNKEYSPFSDKIVLPYDANFVNFEFVSLDFSNPVRNQYKYKLEGFDKNFIEAKNRRFASYTNLEPGEYRFVVVGSNSDDVWNSKGASIDIVITPPFWKTWWFYIFLSFTILFILYTIYRLRVNQKLERIAFVEQMRKRIADDFHDELGHKLTKISLYSHLMKKELQGKLNGSEEYLIKINETANTLYDDTKDFIWSVDPGKDSLYDLAVYLKDFGDELFDKTGISFRVVEIPVTLQKYSLSMNFKRQLILLFKEAMNNALKHSKCKNVELFIVTNGDLFEFVLKDDGEGITSDDGKGRGLANMNNRASKIGGKLIVDSKCSGTLIKFIGNIQDIIHKK